MKNENPTHTFQPRTEEVAFRDITVGALLWSPFGYEASVTSIFVQGAYRVLTVLVERGPAEGETQVIEAMADELTTVKTGIVRVD